MALKSSWAARINEGLIGRSERTKVAARCNEDSLLYAPSKKRLGFSTVIDLIAAPYKPISLRPAITLRHTKWIPSGCRASRSRLSAVGGLGRANCVVSFHHNSVAEAALPQGLDRHEPFGEARARLRRVSAALEPVIPK
jgi:hypothetical protein